MVAVMLVGCSYNTIQRPRGNVTFTNTSQRGDTYKLTYGFRWKKVVLSPEESYTFSNEYLGGMKYLTIVWIPEFLDANSSKHSIYTRTKEMRFWVPITGKTVDLHQAFKEIKTTRKGPKK